MSNQVVKKETKIEEFIFIAGSNGSGRFYIPSLDVSMSIVDFNVAYNHLVPEQARKRILDANKYWSLLPEEKKIIVHDEQYLPTHDELIVEKDGKRVLNSYRPWSGELPKGLSKNGEIYITVLKKHLDLLCGDQSELFLDWIKHQVQHTGNLLRFCPVIISWQGSGKSFLKSLLAPIMGKSNVSHVENSQLGSQFDSWSEGKAAVALEEIKLHGKYAEETYNKLKTKITESEIQINPKHQAVKVIENYTNYLAFSNYENPIPLDPYDRRYWIIEHICKDKQVFLDLFPMEIKGKSFRNSQELFTYLFEGTKDESLMAEMRWYLLNETISDEFLEYSEAPMTEGKRRIIEDVGSRITGLHEAIILLNQQSRDTTGDRLGYNSKVIIPAQLLKDLKDVYKIDLSPRKQGELFKNGLGMTKVRAVNTPEFGKQDVYVSQDLEGVSRRDIPSYLGSGY